MAEDELDGCDLILTEEEIVKDEDVAAAVLFAGVESPQEAEDLARQWAGVFGA
jgi:hypothetical protein